MKIYSLEYIIENAKNNCPYYMDLYKDLPKNYTWDDIPFIVQKDYWDSKLSHLTKKQNDGQIFKSGGTTGEPKYSYYSKEEWETFFMISAVHLPKSGLKNGDRVANLFYTGGLYASFLYCYSMLHFSPTPLLQFSLTGNIDIDEIVNTVKNHEINVIAGIPSIIMKIMEYIEENKVENLMLDTIHFAGETLYPEQREKICKVLNKDITFRSMGYASNDGGIIGYFSEDCGYNEHRVYDKYCKIELVDETTGEIITEKNKRGKVYITALYRTLMPIIRYPAGDVAEYTEDEGTDRKFRLLGRSEEAARVGYVSIYLEDVKNVLLRANIEYDGEQLILTRENNKDKLTIYIASQQHQLDANERIMDILYKARPILKDAESKGMICKTEVVWCSVADLQYNARTGKLKHIIDNRS